MRASWIQEYEEWFEDKNEMVFSCFDNFLAANQTLYEDYIQQVISKAVKLYFPLVRLSLRSIKK